MFKFMPLLLIAATSPAIAQAPASQPQPQVAQTAKDPLDKIVCRTEEGLGSRLNKKRVCMSLRDWKEQAEAARDETQRMQQMHADQMKPDG